MKVNLYSVTGTKKGSVELPKQFEEPVRKDIIKRAVFAIQSHNYQPYGSDPRAGTKQGEAMPKRRKKYKTTYGHGISRVKRKITWRRGRSMGWVGAFVANAIGGRKAFPPLAWKKLTEKINKKERRKAIRSALGAAAVKELVSSRHAIGKLDIFPLVVENKIETLNKTKDVLQTLSKLGLNEELERVEGKKVRAGKGTMRNRKYRKKKGPLLVVSETCSTLKSAKNIPGIDIVEVKKLNTELLAPGTQPGRLTVFSENSLKKMKEEGLFL
jgi:large subunit ribosomal protein L4e